MKEQRCRTIGLTCIMGFGDRFKIPLSFIWEWRFGEGRENERGNNILGGEKVNMERECLIKNYFLKHKIRKILFKIYRVVKMGWNPWVNPAHHGFESGWVEIFLQISIRVDFWPGSSGLNSWWAGLADKRVTQVFLFIFIKLGFTFGSC